MHTCFSCGGPNPFKGAKSDNLIELRQTGFNRFTVIYGLQVDKDLYYDKAALKLGAAIMHYQATCGQLDNRTRAEARTHGDTKPIFEATQ